MDAPIDATSQTVRDLTLWPLAVTDFRRDRRLFDLWCVCVYVGERGERGGGRSWIFVSIAAFFTISKEKKKKMNVCLSTVCRASMLCAETYIHCLFFFFLFFFFVCILGLMLGECRVCAKTYIHFLFFSFSFFLFCMHTRLDAGRRWRFGTMSIISLASLATGLNGTSSFQSTRAFHRSFGCFRP